MIESLMGWRTVYEISSERHGTRAGKNHLTEHGLEILENAFRQDNAVLQRAMLTSMFGFLVPG